MSIVSIKILSFIEKTQNRETLLTTSKMAGFNCIRNMFICLSDMLECTAQHLDSICMPGYECRTSPENYYTGICYHMCDVQTELCKNGGHCYFDAIKKDTACR